MYHVNKDPKKSILETPRARLPLHFFTQKDQM
jgi:hypothetical protein